MSPTTRVARTLSTRPPRSRARRPASTTVSRIKGVSSTVTRVGVELLGVSGGYPILWCHGGLSSRLDARVIAVAADRAGVAVVSIDRPGVGSAPTRSAMSVADWAQTALLEMTRLGHDHFSVAGWSAGGPYALACAAADPGRVDRVATIASMHPLVDDRYRRELGMMLDRVLFRWAVDHPRWARLMVWVGSLTPDRVVIGNVVRSAVEVERHCLRAEAPVVLAFLREATRNGPSGVVDDYARLSADWGFDLGAVQCHVTLWHGTDDPLVPISHGRDLARKLSAAKFEELSGRGHFLPFTDAATIISDLVDRTGTN